MAALTRSTGIYRVSKELLKPVSAKSSAQRVQAEAADRPKEVLIIHLNQSLSLPGFSSTSRGRIGQMAQSILAWTQLLEKLFESFAFIIIILIISLQIDPKLA